MKKILLQKERDETNAAQSGNQHPVVPSESPHRNSSATPKDDCQRRPVSSDDFSRTAAMPGGRSGLRTPSGEQSRITAPSRECPPPSFPEMRMASPLVSAGSVPMAPFMMIGPMAKGPLGIEEYCVGGASTSVFGVPQYGFPRFYEMGDRSSSAHHEGKELKDRVDLKAISQELLCFDLKNTKHLHQSRHESTVGRFQARGELQDFGSKPDYQEKSFAGLLLAEKQTKTKRRDVSLDSVSSSGRNVEKAGDSMEVVDVDSEDEGRAIRRPRSSATRDDGIRDLPRMINQERQLMQISPQNTSDFHCHSKNEHARSDSLESIRSAESACQKTAAYRPKGRPAKQSGSGDSGPGGRSIIRCPVCAKLFNNSSALAKHKLTHSDERKYACTLCSKAFKRQDHLNGHMMTHSSTKPFGCKFVGCNKSYCDARSLRRHMENHHQECVATGSAAGSSAGFFNFDPVFHQSYRGEAGVGGSGDMPVSYLQQVSPISPVARDGSSRHSTTTTAPSNPSQSNMWITGYNPLDEPKPIKCEVCGRGFKNTPALNGHMRLHGGYIRREADESQDVSRGGDPRSDSRLSHQSESSHQSVMSISDRQSTVSFNDRQSTMSISDHQPDVLTIPSHPISSEMDRRHFVLSLGGRDGKPARGSFERDPAVPDSGKQPFYENVSYFDRSRSETGITGAKNFELDMRRGDEGGLLGRRLDVRHDVEFHGFRASETEIDRHALRSRSSVYDKDEIIPGFRGRQMIEEKFLPEKMKYPAISDVCKTSDSCSLPKTSNLKPKAKNEDKKQEFGAAHSFDVRELARSERSVRKPRVCDEMPCPSMDLTVKPSQLVRSVEGLSAEFSGGLSFQRGARPSNGSKCDLSYWAKMPSPAVSQRRLEKVGGEGRRRASSGKDLPDSTSGKEEIDVCRVDVENSMQEPLCLPSKFISPCASAREEAVGSSVTFGADEKPVAAKGYLLSPPSVADQSAENVESGCLYRKRWLNLQLRHNGECHSEVPGDRPSSPAKASCHKDQASFGASTDCGDPQSPKSTQNVPVHSSIGARSCNGRDADVRSSTYSSCHSGSPDTGLAAPKSGPATPVPHCGPSFSPMCKRGAFSYPNVTVQRDVTAGMVHSAVAGRDVAAGTIHGLHHVHSNGCIITQVDPHQAPHIPCSPYDPHPHTPCAAHTPYMPCQPYTPHTPYTPVNRPGTPKLASHFEFPPRDCLQESSMCDSPFMVPGNPMAQEMEVHHAMEAEGDHYHPLQKLGMVGIETELKGLRQHSHEFSFESASRLRLTKQRSLDRQQSYLVKPVLAGNPCHPGIENQAKNPEAGMSPSLPTGAKRDSPVGECDPGEGKTWEKTERKRKPSTEIESETERKKPTVEGKFESAASNKDGMPSLVPQTKSECHPTTEKIERAEKEPECSSSLVDLDGRGVFRNPPSPVKVKKIKHRPEPLHIPTNVNQFGFPSRLRSPRLWDGFAKPTPPPYTPPPMLSPARSGSGLFWTLHSGYHSPMALPPVLPKCDNTKSGKPWKDDFPPATTEEDRVEPPETDVLPHINIGPQYQPELPECRGPRPIGREHAGYEDCSTLVWSPNIMSSLREEEVSRYMDFACCAAIPGNGLNKEYALHLLHLCKGDMKKAGSLLLEPEQKLPRSSGLKSYKYQECVKWKPPEIERFHQAIMDVDKDFFQIAKLVSTKSVKDCVQFYYLWKKICADDSKKLKLLRQKREQFELYSRRSKDVHSSNTSSSSSSQLPKPRRVQHPPKSDDKANISACLKNDSDFGDPMYKASSSTGCVSVKEEKVEDSEEKHWCSVCSRGFTSMRNFSIHMKKHGRSKLERDEQRSSSKLPYATLDSVV